MGQLIEKLLPWIVAAATFAASMIADMITRSC